MANKKSGTILQCTLVDAEYTVKSISVLQIYTYSRTHHSISLCTENILSTLLKCLKQYRSVHWSIQCTLSNLYLFTKSIHIFQGRTSFTVHWRYLEYTVYDHEQSFRNGHHTYLLTYTLSFLFWGGEGSHTMSKQEAPRSIMGRRTTGL